jgi:hypothetical protein
MANTLPDYRLKKDLIWSPFTRVKESHTDKPEIICKF